MALILILEKMKTVIISGILVMTTLFALGQKPKLVIKEADKCKISKSTLDNSGPTAMLENGAGYTVESFDVCMMTKGPMECFPQSDKIERGAQDNLKLLQPGMKFCLKNVVVKDKATGKTRKVSGKKYKVV